VSVAVGRESGSGLSHHRPSLLAREAGVVVVAVGRRPLRARTSVLCAWPGRADHERRGQSRAWVRMCLGQL
jgi:hypothetical protein